MIWFEPNVQSQERHIALPGLLIAFAASFCWALYGVLIKRPSARLGSIRSFGLVSFITSALLFPLTLAFGKIDTPLHTAADVNVILAISAVTCITLSPRFVLCGNPPNWSRARPNPPASMPRRRQDLAWIFHERLTRMQLWSAAILLAGAFLAMRVKPITTTETAENI